VVCVVLGLAELVLSMASSPGQHSIKPVNTLRYTYSYSTRRTRLDSSRRSHGQLKQSHANLNLSTTEGIESDAPEFRGQTAMRHNHSPLAARQSWMHWCSSGRS
jgi:hypothetical protein